jgi:RNA 2',3'-cyclic 3'-phosphodiesterase
MRLFTAIDLPAEIVERLDGLIAKLRPLARIGWSKAANLHITTKFIGAWPEERMVELTAALAGLGPRQPIPIRVHGLGFFPNPQSPRVFWAGVEAEPELTALAGAIDAAVAGLGGEPETRPYSPHLTLARIKQPAGLEIFHKEVGRLGSPGFGLYRADRFYLYLSQPGPGGSVYTKLSEFPFSTQ